MRLKNCLTQFVNEFDNVYPILIDSTVFFRSLLKVFIRCRSQVKRPSKETKHHFDDCHILIQSYFCVSELEFFVALERSRSVMM